MKYTEIEKLVSEYADALDAESDALLSKATAQIALENFENEIVSNAYADGTIDGKNAEARKAQVAGVLVSSDGYNMRQQTLREMEKRLAQAEIERKRIEMLCSLTRAWLYSQRENL